VLAVRRGSDEEQLGALGREGDGDVRLSTRGGGESPEVPTDAAAAEYKLPEKYAGYTNNPDRVKLNVGVIYDELQK